jgi:hypothetical protein
MENLRAAGCFDLRLPAARFECQAEKQSKPPSNKIMARIPGLDR